MTTDDMTPRLQEIYKKALVMGLENPLGRAVYVLNRRYNGGYQRDTDEVILLRVQPSTAERWLAHWQNGGGVKSLSARRNGAQVSSSTNGRRAISLDGRLR